MEMMADERTRAVNNVSQATSPADGLIAAYFALIFCVILAWKGHGEQVDDDSSGFIPGETRSVS